MTWRRGDQQHAAGLRTGISERVRCAGWDKYASSRSAAHSTLATAQIELSFENVKDLLDFGVVMRTSVEPWGDRKLEQRALLGVLGRDQIIDPSLVQGDIVGLTVRMSPSTDICASCSRGGYGNVLMRATWPLMLLKAHHVRS
jgi:hypothetical protein